MLNTIASPRTQKQLFLFLFIGGINTVFSYAIFSLLIYMKLHYTLACLLATIMGILFNFKTTGRIVFNNKDNSRIYSFFMIYGIVFVVNLMTLKMGSYFIDNMYMVGALSIPVTALLSFTLNKYFVFQEKPL